MSRRRSPRPLAAALSETMSRTAPATPLAAIQAAWADAVGGRIAAEARPVEERDGVLTVACRSATWAEELDLLASELLAKLQDRLEAGVAPRALRFRTGDPGTDTLST